MTVTRSSFRTVVYSALAVSVLGLILVCLLILGADYTQKFAASYWPQILAGYFAMLVIVELLGVPLRSGLCHYWAGMIFSVTLFLVAVVTGSVTSMILYGDMDVHSYVVKPLFWLGFYGFIPAAIIGAFSTGFVRARSYCAEQDVPAKSDRSGG